MKSTGASWIIFTQGKLYRKFFYILAVIMSYGCKYFYGIPEKAMDVIPYPYVNFNYRKVSNIRRTKSQNLNASRLTL